MASVAKVFTGAITPQQCSAGDGPVVDGCLMTDGSAWHSGCYDRTEYPMPGPGIHIPDDWP